jgi:PAS domain S-box-containing protein
MKNSITSNSYTGLLPTEILGGISILILICLASLNNYLLFHSLSEFFSIVISCGIFMIAWNSKDFMKNNYIIFIGIGYLFIGGLDMLHVLSYKGMGVLQSDGGNIPTQLWIAARYLESLTLLIAPLLIAKKIKSKPILWIFLLLTAALIASIFHWQIFPDCFVDGVGLTSFKKISEYVISLVLIGALVLLFRQRHTLDQSVYRFLSISIVLTIASELAFTFYISVYGFSNLVGHLLKIISFFLIYKAIIYTGIKKPYQLMFNQISEKEKALRLSLDAAKAGIWSWNILTGEVIFDDRMQHIFGIKPGTFDGTFEAWKKCIHPDDLEAAEQTILKALDTNEGYDFEYRVKGFSGDWRIVNSKAGILRDDKGTPVMMSGFATDITDRRQSEEKLAESEKRYRQIFEKNPAVKLIINPEDGAIVEANKAACEFYGYSDDKIMSLKISDINTLPLDKVVEEMENAKSEKRKYFNFSHKLASGEIRDVEVYSGPVKFGQSTFLHSIVHDITEHKNAEEEIARQKNLFETMFNTIPDGVVITNTDRKIQLASKGMKSTFGYKPEDLLGKSTKILYADSDKYQEAGEAVFDGNTRKAEDLYITRYQDISGRVFSGETFGAKLFDENNEWIGNLGIMRDITEREQAEIRIQQAQRMESIGDLAGGIAHDFNNLLFPIIGMAEILLEDLPSGSLEYENAQEIYNAGIRAGDLVKQILAFSRQSEHKMIPVRVQNVLREVLKLSRSTIPADIEIHQDIQNDCGSIKADATQIHQVAMNLITNAYHAVQEKGGKISVNLEQITLGKGELIVSVLDQGEYAVLTISDTGSGIKPNIVGKIFDPYFTTKEQGKGTGLGLAVVFGIVKEHKGDIKVYSEMGKGTIFKVYLPLMKKSIETFSTGITKKIETGTERILLVDDEVYVAKLVGQMLSRLGYRVTEQIESLDALKMFKANPDNFDLVITDMAMPDMTGDNFAKEIISLKPDIPVIICTGYSERINKEQSEALGVKGFIMKLVVISEMAKMVRKALDEN